MKHLIVSAAALTLLAGSAFAQEATTNPPPAAPAQTAPRDATPPPPPPPPAELAPQGGGNQGDADEEADARSSSGMEDQFEDRGPDQRGPGMERGHGGPGGHHWDRDRPRGRHWRGGDHGPRRGPGNEGAQFRVTTKEDGGVELDVRCAANEPMQACADIVNGLLDRLNNNESATDERSDL